MLKIFKKNLHVGVHDDGSTQFTKGPKEKEIQSSQRPLIL